MEKRGNGTIEHDTVPLVGRERNTLSVTDGCLGRGGDGTIMRFGGAEWVINIAHSLKFLPSRQLSSQGGTLPDIGHWFSWRWPMPHYYFDIKDGHRLVDPSGLEFKNDDAAIAKAKVIAIGVSLDKPAVDPKRHIAVLNGSRKQIFSVPVYSKPSMSTT
jgi:hypothetical protein